MFAEIFITVILMIPVYALLIWTYIEPEESIMFGRRWRYEVEPEVSPSAVRYAKFSAVIMMVFLPIIILNIFLEIYMLRLVFLVLPLVLIIGGFRIFLKSY